MVPKTGDALSFFSTRGKHLSECTNVELLPLFYSFPKSVVAEYDVLNWVSWKYCR